MQLELTGAELDEVRSILRRWAPGCEVWAFGSRVGGNPKPYSDLDLVILGATPLSLAQMADLTEAFCQSDLPFRVDLVDWSSASPDFQEVMRQRHQVIWPALGGQA